MTKRSHPVSVARLPCGLLGPEPNAPLLSAGLAAYMSAVGGAGTNGAGAEEQLRLR